MQAAALREAYGEARRGADRHQAAHAGRAGFELVQKAVAAGVGSLVAVGAPSSLAVRLAERSGLHLYGFTSEDRCVLYPRAN